jgi:hypothetical protein
MKDLQALKRVLKSHSYAPDPRKEGEHETWTSSRDASNQVLLDYGGDEWHHMRHGDVDQTGPLSDHTSLDVHLNQVSEGILDKIRGKILGKKPEKEPRTNLRPVNAPMTKKGAERVLDHDDGEGDGSHLPYFKPSWETVAVANGRNPYTMIQEIMIPVDRRN